MTYKSKEYVLNSEGKICGEVEDNTSTNETSSNSSNSTNSGLRYLETVDYSNYYEYILILPNPFIAEDTAIKEA